MKINGLKGSYINPINEPSPEGRLIKFWADPEMFKSLDESKMPRRGNIAYGQFLAIPVEFNLSVNPNVSAASFSAVRGKKAKPHKKGIIPPKVAS